MGQYAGKRERWGGLGEGGGGGGVGGRGGGGGGGGEESRKVWKNYIACLSVILCAH